MSVEDSRHNGTLVTSQTAEAQLSRQTTAPDVCQGPSTGMQAELYVWTAPGIHFFSEELRRQAEANARQVIGLATSDQSSRNAQIARKTMRYRNMVARP